MVVKAPMRILIGRFAPGLCQKRGARLPEAIHHDRCRKAFGVTLVLSRVISSLYFLDLVECVGRTLLFERRPIRGGCGRRLPCRHLLGNRLSGRCRWRHRSWSRNRHRWCGNLRDRRAVLVLLAHFLPPLDVGNATANQPWPTVSLPPTWRYGRAAKSVLAASRAPAPRSASRQ